MGSCDLQTRVLYLADRISLQAGWLKLLYNVMSICKCVWWMCRAQLHGCMGRNHETLRQLRSIDTNFSYRTLASEWLALVRTWEVSSSNVGLEIDYPD